MDRSTVIYLLSTSSTQNGYGVWEETTTRKKVYCRVSSVTRAEFFGGGRNGLNPDIVFTMFFGDYNGAPIVEYNGQSYAVYRTFQRKTDAIELYCQRKGGTNGKEEDSAH